MKMKKICQYKGTIKLITGLAIKDSSSELRIGGADSKVIKNPITGEPYIPGSSLKGKMRSQLEKNKGIEKEEPCGCGKKDCMICTLFGAHGTPRENHSAPTRIIVRDCYYTEDARNTIKNMLEEQGGYLETKAENLVKRIKGTAGDPRTMERVPAGLEFEMEILLQVFEDDDEKEMKENVEKALNLVELSYLGGSGSRGYGQVKFTGEWKEIEV